MEDVSDVETDAQIESKTSTTVEQEKTMPPVEGMEDIEV